AVHVEHGAARPAHRRRCRRLAHCSRLGAAPVAWAALQKLTFLIMGGGLSRSRRADVRRALNARRNLSPPAPPGGASAAISAFHAASVLGSAGGTGSGTSAASPTRSSIMVASDLDA